MSSPFMPDHTQTQLAVYHNRLAKCGAYPVRTLVRNSAFQWLVALGAHAALALLMQALPMAATLHALVAVTFALWLVLHDREPERFVAVAGYMVTAEVLWRMTAAQVFWEFGKLALIVVMSAAIIKWRVRIWLLAVIYFLLLVPSAALTLLESPWSRARQLLSFNLTGPLALALVVAFMARVSISKAGLQRLWRAALLPIAGMGFLATYATVSASTLDFTRESNFVTSGGFGPNQVSAVLGLGALLALLLLVSSDHWGPPHRGLLVGLIVWLLAQAVLTFSRGGVANFAAAALVAAVTVLRFGRIGPGRLLAAATIVGVIGVVTVRQLEAITAGQLSARYQELNLTNREVLARLDLELWQSNLWVGVGPGQSMTSRLVLHSSVRAVAHTEYTRMLAEHGLLGLLALGLLGLMPLRALKRPGPPLLRGLMLALMVWSLAEMSHSAMRISAIAFMYGLAFIEVRPDS